MQKDRRARLENKRYHCYDSDDAVMILLLRRLPRSQRYKLQQREITEEIVRRTDPVYRIDDGQLRRLSLAAHFGYGAASGAAYPALGSIPQYVTATDRCQRKRLGLLVWALSYLGWIPAMHIHFFSQRRAIPDYGVG